MRYLFLFLFALIVNTASAQVLDSDITSADETYVADTVRIEAFLETVDEAAISADTAGAIESSAPTMILEHIEEIPVIAWGIIEYGNENTRPTYYGYVEVGSDKDDIRTFVSMAFIHVGPDTKGVLTDLFGWEFVKANILVVSEKYCKEDCLEYVERGMQTFGVDLRKVNRFPWPPPEQEFSTR